jgi:nucleotide-binding universal stress UspA family protein
MTGPETTRLIVVGYVPKAEGRAAVAVALQEAKLRGARLLVINSAVGGSALTSADAVSGEAELDHLRAQMASAGVEGDARMFVRGLDPAHDIVQAADEQNAELIVIGLRRRTPVGKLILGSNAQRILLDAHCPVLAVKAGEDD